MDGWSDKTKVILNSTQVKIEVEVGVELGKSRRNTREVKEEKEKTQAQNLCKSCVS